jgi:hypothetical protein
VKYWTKHSLGLRSSLGGASLIKEQIMATQTQQVVDYLKAHPDMARKAMDYVKSHPGDFKTALRDLATQRGWDLSQLDTATLTKELGKIVPH